MTPEPQPRRLAYLDGLRAIAVLSVIAFHSVCFGTWSLAALVAPMHADAGWWAVDFMAKGSHGVDLFFVLSGFCLSYPTLARIAETGRTRFEVWSFFAKRTVRIGPPYWVALGLMTALALGFAHAGIRAHDVDLAGTAPLAVLAQALFLDRRVPLADGSFWTLFFELRWYLAFPVLLALYVRNRRAFVVLLVALAFAYEFTTLHAVDIAVLPAFMLGIIAADRPLIDKLLPRHLFLALIVAFDVATLLEPYASLPPSNGSAEEFGFSAQSNVGWQLLSFFFVIAAGRWRWLERALSWRPLAAIGAASYSIYLVHQPLVTYWEESFVPGRSGPMMVAGSYAVALAGGALFYLAVERPLIGERFRGIALPPARRAVARIGRLCGIAERVTLGAPSALAPAATAPTEITPPPVDARPAEVAADTGRR